MFNPTLKDFMKKKPNLTVFGVVWAGWWRLYLCILGVYAIIAIIVLAIA